MGACLYRGPRSSTPGFGGAFRALRPHHPGPKLDRGTLLKRLRLLFFRGQRTPSCRRRGYLSEASAVPPVDSTLAVATSRRRRTFLLRTGSRHARLHFAVRGCCQANRTPGKVPACSFLYG